MKTAFDLNKGEWINRPEEFSLASDRLTLTTSGGTDFWQRSYYGFRNDNAPALLFSSRENFTLSCRVDFVYRQRFDQAGIILYLDSENWFKASIEYENNSVGRLGSVVTNNGYSDWATRDIEPVNSVWYRLSRRGADFLVESALAEGVYQQVRIFHLHVLGQTDPDKAAERFMRGLEDSAVRFGFYACSPSESSFTAEFSSIIYEDSRWEAHS